MGTRGGFTPYPRGVCRTWYVYHVDRPRFHKGSAVWRKDIDAVASVWAKEGGVRVVDFPEDPDMLYIELLDNVRAVVVGAVFARNSGTENKVAAYARGLAGWEGQLCEAASAMRDLTSIVYFFAPGMGLKAILIVTCARLTKRPLTASSPVVARTT